MDLNLTPEQDRNNANAEAHLAMDHSSKTGAQRTSQDISQLLSPPSYSECGPPPPRYTERPAITFDTIREPSEIENNNSDSGYESHSRFWMIAAVHAFIWTLLGVATVLGTIASMHQGTGSA